jgi:pilus assembly protein Flp/PilA
MHKIYRDFIEDKRGATALEYVVIASLVSIVILAGATQIGTRLSSLYFARLIGNF